MIRPLLKIAILHSLILIIVGYPDRLFAQLKITFPVNRMVLQRNAANQAAVQIAGSYSQVLDVIEARAVVRATGQGTTTSWSILQVNPSNGQFNGSINVAGGWYKIQVRGLKNGSVVAADSVERFGVGEVFAIIGHSNAQGSSCVINGVNQCETIDGASDERVNVIGIDLHTTVYQQQYLTTANTDYLPGLAFSQLLKLSGTSPFAQEAWLWGHMGDELVKRINVPVLLYNAGFGGTTIQNTYWSAYDIPFEHSFVRYSIRMPFVNLRNIMNLYVPTTGLRAVLILHGENDRFNPTDSTYKYYNKVIDKMRTEFNKPNLGCIVALSSFVGGRNDNVRLAQLQVINRPNYNAYPGPDLDVITTSADRPDGIHYSPGGQVKAGDLWASAINNVWSSITPYPAETQPMVSLSCATTNQLTLNQPVGYEYSWNTGSTVRGLTVGTGTYSARIKNAQKRIFFPPAVVVPTTVQPSPPTITTDNGTWAICRTSGLKLRSSYTELNAWSTGATSFSILATTPGVYSVQAKHPVYGCLSNVVSQTVGLATVNLNVQIQTSRRVVAVNDTVSFRLFVQNKSECDAGPVTVKSRLPLHLGAVSNSASTTVVNGVVSSTIPGILAGETINRQFTAQPDHPGYYRTAAELTATTNTDYNAKSNNGTGNGEDDEAVVDLRTMTSSSDLFESPNPNQGLLPVVQSNQPTPAMTKADLSLKMEVNSQVTRVDKLIEITLTVKNLGGLAATNVGVRNLLPATLQFVESGSGMSATGAVVSGSIGQIAAGQSISLTFTARVISNESCTNQAQIMSADQPDSDSTPGNGYSNGEDDQASIVLRTAG